MYDIENFVGYDGIDLEHDHVVLVWSSKSGYHFTEYKNVDECEKIVAREK